MSYFSQLKEVYDVFGLKQPVIYPRSSVTIVEDKVKKAIEKAGVSSELFNHEMKDALSITLKKSLGIDVETILKSLQEDILIKTGCARDIIDNNGIICEACFGRLEYNLKREIEILNKKIMSEIENKNLSLASNIVKIYANLFPEGLLQERVINIFHYINKYDFKLLDDLYSIINVENRFHKFIFL